MSPAQRQQLAAIERRGFFLPMARDLGRTMQRIDNRAPLSQTRSHTQAKAVWWGELIGACILIAIFLAVAFFVA